MDKEDLLTCNTRRNARWMEAVAQLGTDNWCGVPGYISLQGINQFPVVKKIYALRIAWESMLQELQCSTDAEASYLDTTYGFRIDVYQENFALRVGRGRPLIGIWMMLQACPFAC